MRMREHLETRVHIGEGGPCPLSIRGLFRHGKQTCGYHAIKSSRSMLKRCFRFELRRNAIGRFFSSFHFLVGRKFSIILSHSFFFLCAQSMVALVLETWRKETERFFLERSEFKLDFEKFTK